MITKKLNDLKKIISEYNSAAIAFSGGVDSTFLARAAKEVLGDNILLVTAASSTYPFEELEESKKLAARLGLEQLIIVSEEIEIPGFSENTPDRCYYCKSELFMKINKIAGKRNLEAVFDGTNVDDLGDYRPGRKAIEELGIRSPICEAGLTKKEIRKISLDYGLPTANKPAFACLASRFPYGEDITKEKLKRVEKCESEIRKLGFGQFRVRSHEDLARIELSTEEMPRGWEKRVELDKICKNAGFTYSSIDLRGYRTGAMNETIHTNFV